jgi:Ca2+-transporting ATPase
VNPEDKFKIIKHFQDADNIAGLTNDGVDDAPALKQADIGRCDMSD